MARTDFLKQLRLICAQLRGSLAATTGQWLQDVARSGLDEARDKPIKLKLSRVFELVCYVESVVEFASHGRATWILGRNGEYALPHNPGHKENFAFCRISLPHCTIDVCNGTEVFARDANQPGEHPDITVQIASDSATVDRSPGKVLAAWDAKHGSEDDRGKDILQDFLYWVEVIGIPRPSAGDVLGILRANSPFAVSGVLTNSRHKRLNSATRLRNGFSVVFRFQSRHDCAPPEPTRAEQLQFNVTGCAPSSV